VSKAGREQALTSEFMRRADSWRQAIERIRRLSTKRTDDVEDALRVADDYRLLAHDLARARRLAPASRALEYLESAYAQTHASLRKTASHPGYALWSLFRDQIPAVVHELRHYIFWVTLLFIASTVAGAWLVHTYPNLIGLFASPDLIATVERGELWTESLLNVTPSSVLSLRILTNNIVVSVVAYCAGLVFGLGTFYIVGLNGLMLGCIFMFTAQHGLADGLFSFVVAHGCVELSVMCLSGAAGAAVGEALIRPGEGGRAKSFQLAAMRSGKLLLACVVLLVGAGIIEGFVSPNPDFPLWTRIVIGVGYWLFMVALLRGWLFGRSRSTRAVAV